MARKTLCREDIIKYAQPELETLKALFASLNLKSSVAAVDFAKTVFEFELNRNFSTDVTKETAPKSQSVWKV